MAKELEPLKNTNSLPLTKSENIRMSVLDSLMPWASLRATNNAMLGLPSFVQRVVGAMQESVAKSLEMAHG